MFKKNCLVYQKCQNSDGLGCRLETLLLEFLKALLVSRLTIQFELCLYKSSHIEDLMPPIIYIEKPPYLKPFAKI